MAAKLQIASFTHTEEELAAILADYTAVPLVRHAQLFGGYSGCSYRVELEDGMRFVVKVSNGYSFDDTEFMCRTARHLAEVGYEECCLPIPKAAAGDGHEAKYRLVSLKERRGVPAFLLTHVIGRPADRVMRESPAFAVAVMRGIGDGLGRMHFLTEINDGAEKVVAEHGLRWYVKDGGCCDVQDQLDGKILAKIASSETVKHHAFVPFYEKELAALREEMTLAQDGTLGLGITHGDPFADNVLVDPGTGELAAFIDIEDVCVGPLLFDLACCAIGCCFKEGDATNNSGVGGESGARCRPQVLDFDLLAALLEGYSSGRALARVEREHFVPYMRLTLLCNCCWRFVKFNVVDAAAASDDVPEEAKDAYLELQRRIEYLHDPDVVRKVQDIVDRQQQ